MITSSISGKLRGSYPVSGKVDLIDSGFPGLFIPALSRLLSQSDILQITSLLPRVPFRKENVSPERLVMSMVFC